MKAITKAEAIKLLREQNVMLTEQEARKQFAIFGLSYIK